MNELKELQEIRDKLVDISHEIENKIKMEFDYEMKKLRKEDVYFNIYKSLIAKIQKSDCKYKNGAFYFKINDVISIIQKTGSTNQTNTEFKFFCWMIKKNLSVGYKLIKFGDKQVRCLGILN